MLVIGPHGQVLRGDASIVPYIHFAGNTVGRGLDPSFAVHYSIHAKRAMPFPGIALL